MYVVLDKINITVIQLFKTRLSQEDSNVGTLSVCCCMCPAGVGGIEAEAVMLGQPISMVLPKVVGYKLVGKLGQLATSTDVVLTITKVRPS